MLWSCTFARSLAHSCNKHLHINLIFYVAQAMSFASVWCPRPTPVSWVGLREPKAEVSGFSLRCEIQLHLTASPVCPLVFRRFDEIEGQSPLETFTPLNATAAGDTRGDFASFCCAGMIQLKGKTSPPSLKSTKKDWTGGSSWFMWWLVMLGGGAMRPSSQGWC